MRGLEQVSRGASRSQQLRLVVALGCLLGAALALPCAVQAQVAGDESQDAEAKMLFQAGEVAFEAGRFKAALGRWEEAYRLSGRPALQYNIGLALDRLRRDQEAIAAFRAYLTWDAKGERAQEVRGRIAAIEEAMATRAAEQAAAEQAAAEQAAADKQAAERAAAAAESAQVASPQEAAATVADESAPAPLDGPAPESSLTAQWWFWPSVGVLAAGVLAGVVVAASGGEDEVKPLEMENISVMFSTLSRADGACAGASR